jgi:ribosome-associated heat shock protein Hsp15
MTDDHERPSAREQDDPTGTQRLDKWLWFARVTKSRTLAAQLVLDGKVRVNRAKATKPSQSVRRGDVLTLAVRGKVEVLRVVAAGARRGPPAEARQLYEALSSTGGHPREDIAPREPGAGRPTKRDRRLTDRLTEDG